ncbi:MAG TPA: hemolysin family protein [Thermoanaerobaculia bacterium]|nr:hemolysin family protein [Thermoanaerobaculia bacterium]
MTVTIMFELLLILILVVANGLFAMSEIAIVSASKARLQGLQQKGSRRAAAALRLATHPDRFLPTIQIGITLIGIFAGAFGGATLAGQIDERLEQIPALVPWSEVIGVGVVVITITYLSLVLGELVPKRLALNDPERVATMVAPPLEIVARFAGPAITFLAWSTRSVLAILRAKPPLNVGTTEEEVRLMLLHGSQAGTIEREEREIIERAFRLGDRPVRAVMTPRIEVEWVDLDQPFELLLQNAAESSHSRLPVARGGIDHVEGILEVRRLIGADSESIRSLIREPLFVPETASALGLLSTFRSTRNHVAIVIDEFGGFEGMVTPIDILEALVGELPAEEDQDELMIFRRADGSWSVDAAVDLEEVKLMLNISWLEGQKDNAYQTIAGYLIQHVGRIPRIGERFEISGWLFEIQDTNGRRIDRILVSAAEKGDPEP